METQDHTTKCEGVLSEAIKKRGEFHNCPLCLLTPKKSNLSITNIAKSFEIAKFVYLCTDFFTFVPLLGERVRKLARSPFLLVERWATF